MGLDSFRDVRQQRLEAIEVDLASVRCDHFFGEDALAVLGSVVDLLLRAKALAIQRRRFRHRIEEILDFRWRCVRAERSRHGVEILEHVTERLFSVRWDLKLSPNLAAE